MIHTILFSFWFFVVLIDVFEELKIRNAIERKKIVKADKKKKGSESGTGAIAAIEMFTDMILPGFQPDKVMTFREDMYCLLFVSLVKPQYKMYCDIVHKTGAAKPVDADDPNPLIISDLKQQDTGLDDEEMEGMQTWCEKFRSYVCCRRPVFVDGKAEWRS